MLRVHVLGELEVECDGRRIAPPESRRAWALLGWLALHPGRHQRGVIASALWPDVLDSSALQSLRSALWSLRRALGDGADAVAASSDRLGLDPDRTSVDLIEFGALVDAGDLESAYALWRGPLLAGIEEDWAIVARDEATHRLGEALATLCDRAASTGDQPAALHWARRRVALDPFSEEAARLLMRTLSDADDFPAALLVYDRLSERLRRELSVAPSAETRRLAEALRAGRSPDGQHQPLPAAPPRARHRAPRRAARRSRLARLVGRDAELESLLEAWEAACAGSGGVAVAAGPAGIGKTRLLAELAETAAATGGYTAWAAAVGLGHAAPLSPWAELCGEIVRALPTPANSPGWPAELGRLVPAASAWVSEGRAPPARSTLELERARLFEAVCELVAHAAARAPVLLVLDDVHAADDSTLALTAYVARRLHGLPVLLVLGRRDPSHNAAFDGLTRALRAGGSIAVELTLGPLADESVAALVELAGPVPRDRVPEIVAAVEGSPLLAVEAARALARGEDRLPSGLREVVRASLGDLGATGRTLVQVAAVAGGPLTHDDARGLIGATSAEGFAATLSAAERAGLLTAGARQVRFRHELLREAAYEEVPAPVRIALHERIARRLASGGEESAADAARHLRIAGLDDAAATQLARAATHARLLGAASEAEAFLAEAAAIRPEHASIALDLAEAQLACGRRSESAASFDRACAVLERSGDPSALARAHFRRGTWHYSLVCAPHEVRASFRAGLDILDAAGIDSPAARDPARAALAWAEAVGGDPERAAALLDEVEAGDGAVDELTAIEIGRARATALARQERFADSFAPGVAAAEVAERGGWPELAYGCWLNAAGAAVCAGELERALEYVDRCLGAVGGRGLAPLEIQALCARAWVLGRRGRLDEAATAAAAAAELAARIGDDALAAAAANERARVALAGGDCALAAERYGQALAAGGPFSRPIARLERAEALARLGRCDEAERELRDAVLEPVRPGDWPDTLVARIARVQGLVAAARGDEALAARRLEEAAEGWRRRVGVADAGERWSSALADLGRPVVGVVEPDRELARVLEDLENLAVSIRTEA